MTSEQATALALIRTYKGHDAYIEGLKDLAELPRWVPSVSVAKRVLALAKVEAEPVYVIRKVVFGPYQKTCKKCNRTMPLERFKAWPMSKDGHRYTCISCGRMDTRRVADIKQVSSRAYKR